MRALAPTRLKPGFFSRAGPPWARGQLEPCEGARGEAKADALALAHQNRQLLSRGPSGSADRVHSGTDVRRKCTTRKGGLLPSRPTPAARATPQSLLYPLSLTTTLSFSMSTHVFKSKERMFHLSQLILSAPRKAGLEGQRPCKPWPTQSAPTTAQAAPHRLQLLSQLAATVPTLGCSQLVPLPPDSTFLLLFRRQLERPRSGVMVRTVPRDGSIFFS